MYKHTAVRSESSLVFLFNGPLERAPVPLLGGSMEKKLYVGNLPFTITEDALHDMFSQAGAVESARIVTDRATGRSKGFGFVEMASPEEAMEAIKQFDGTDYQGRALTVAEARPQKPQQSRGGYGGGGYGGGGPRGGGNRGGGRGGNSRGNW